MGIRARWTRWACTALGLVSITACGGETDVACPDGDLLRCRVEASGDPAVEKALAPLLGSADDAAPLPSDH